MATRYDKTLADYLVIAVSPALIMTLVGSLVFFLLEVFYQGNFSGRLHYILALFIFAAVLIGRIAIEEGKERAALFALPLAGATLLTIFRFVEFQGPLGQASFIINFGLVALIWWCAHKLTWDCTMIDETEPGSGEGLLDAAGLGESPIGWAERSESHQPKTASSSWDFREFWNKWRASEHKPHAPGVWIVYFSLAALPLFGLGQLAIPAYQEGRRRYAFFLLAIYVASGLGLLLTTSFLGLRRYLRQRRLPMPVIMAGTWLVLGCVLIFGVMGFALLLPRPSAEFAVSQLPRVMGSPDQKPSKHGVGNDGVRSNEPGRPKSGEKGKPSPGRDNKSQPGGKPAEKKGGDAADRNARNSKQEGRNKNDGKDNSQKPENKESGSEKPQDEKRSKPDSNGQHLDEKKRPPNANDPAAQDESKRNDPQSHTSADGPRGDQPKDPQDRRDESKSNQEPENRPGEEPAQPEQNSSPPDAPPPPDVTSTLDWLLPLAKMLFYIVIAGLAAFWAWRHRERIMASLRELLAGLRCLWERLYGGRRKATEAGSEAQNILQPRRFADFADPFAASLANQLSASQLVRYLFAALEAWARENGCPREPEQTPHEFARAVARRVRSLLPSATCLADLYCEAAYAPTQLRIVDMQPLEELWRGLHAPPAAERELAATHP